MKQTHLYYAILLAAVLWLLMFSPWTAPNLPFWPTMTASAALLLTLAAVNGVFGRLKRCGLGLQQVILGVAFAAVLWGIFWVGDKVSQWMFDFARPGVDSIYGMKGGTSPLYISLALLLLIGPTEELFWRGCVQERLQRRLGPNAGFVVATLIYTLIHLWSFNFMLIMAALVCGVCWGGLYRLRPQWLPALSLSHALWDAAAFVWLPF